MYEYSLDNLNLLGSININNNGYFNFRYSESLNSSYIIYSYNTIFINFILGSRITALNISNSVNNGGSSLYNFASFEKSGYFVILTSLGLFIYNQNLKSVYSDLFSTTTQIYQILSYNSSNIYYISDYTTLNVLNYAIKEPVSNPLYPADFNLILSCGCD